MSEYLEKFLSYQAELTDSVAKRPEVIGLIFVGSAAATERVDQYSDQDFFLVVLEGTGENFRQKLDWLPNHQDIAFSPRETAHGLKVVYQNGDVLEFAVFEDSELELSSVNDYSVVLDRQDISERMAKIAKSSIPAATNRAQDIELFFSLILIGVGRARRGEVLAAEQHIKSYALAHGLKLIRAAGASNPRADSLNGFRRFELDYPKLGLEIQNLLLLETEAAAMKLCELVLRELKASDSEMLQYQVVARRLGWTI
ncbi:MAG: hypothetical protein RL024_218 [Actinomycetota bacterium]|jgi:hypothetical protein